jgi:hypothetical protein
MNSWVCVPSCPAWVKKAHVSGGRGPVELMIRGTYDLCKPGQLVPLSRRIRTRGREDAGRGREIETDTMRVMTRLRYALGLALALATGCVGSSAARADTFYQGKQLVVLVNFAQGGPTDAEGRLFARHIARLLGGNPAVIVQNMGGSNGAVAANWLAKAAAPDGLIVGYFSGIASLRALADPILSPDVARLSFVAAGPGFGVAYARTDIGGVIKKPADLMSKKDFWIGGLRADSDRDLRLRMQLDLLGIRHQYQTGFAAITDARQALQRGEIQMLLEPILAYRAVIEPGLVASGAALPMWLDPLDDGVTFQRSAEADNLPALTFTDVLLQARGELPKSDLFDAWRLVNQMGTLFQRILVTAPDTPGPALTALRNAMAQLADDTAFKEDALKSVKSVPAYLSDARTAALFSHIADPEPRLQTFLRKYIDAASPDATPPPPVPNEAPARATR